MVGTGSLTSSGHAVDSIAFRNFAQSGHVTVEDSPALARERDPGASPLANKALLDLHVARLFQGAHLLGEHRITHLNLVSNEAKLNLVGGRQQRHDREANRVSEQAIQLVARMSQCCRPIAAAAAISGITATTALSEKWSPDWCGPHHPVAVLAPTTAAFQIENAATDPVNQRMPVRL